MMKTASILLRLVLLVGLGGPGCHVEQEKSVNGLGADASQVIKFENLTQHGVLIRIPDAHQEFELGIDERRTVEVRSEEGITVFYVEIYQANWDISVAPRWTGFVGIGKRVTIQHISRVYVND